MGGVLVLVFGMLMGGIVLDTAAATMTHPKIAMFPGVESVNGLIPFTYYISIILIGIGLMGFGARGFVSSR
jgi:hypothetical protein